ncbi:hypothetical protein EV702DRAFT_1114549 [Suillus placidus]|uniref:Uncharacterized protein n=1 Tax=Suillus placidus TaxID=48579 RepID=A0A9P7D1I9_9AGAM|nr:hypothetical protein EV702DRAFT_1114549 [Suillus placidus]
MSDLPSAIHPEILLHLDPEYVAIRNAHVAHRVPSRNPLVRIPLLAARLSGRSGLSNWHLRWARYSAR